MATKRPKATIGVSSSTKPDTHKPRRGAAHGGELRQAAGAGASLVEGPALTLACPPVRFRRHHCPSRGARLASSLTKTWINPATRLGNKPAPSAAIQWHAQICIPKQRGPVERPMHCGTVPRHGMYGETCVKKTAPRSLHPQLTFDQEIDRHQSRNRRASGAFLSYPAWLRARRTE